MNTFDHFGKSGQTFFSRPAHHKLNAKKFAGNGGSRGLTPYIGVCNDVAMKNSERERRASGWGSGG